jgi:small subunit ribosomal protein S16
MSGVQDIERRRKRSINPTVGDERAFAAGSQRFTGNQNIMVVIRLARGGANKRPFYNIVVTDSRMRRDGRFIERLGFYNPMAAGGEQPLRVALDRITYWSGVGAQLSPTVKRLVGQAQKQTAPAAA